MSDRQNFEISKDDVNLLPLWQYEGEIVLLNDEEAFAEAAECIRQAGRVGIDTETRPAFRKGESYSVALMQLGLGDIVYLIRLNEHGLPEPIREILEDESIQKIGIGQRDDVRELKRDFECQLRGVVDLNVYCKGLGFKSIGARKLTALVLGKRIPKRQQTSNWECETLSHAQKLYAATDAWICLEIYRLLEAES